jgi:hypothetical protein
VPALAARAEVGEPAPALAAAAEVGHQVGGIRPKEGAWRLARE